MTKKRLPFIALVLILCAAPWSAALGAEKVLRLGGPWAPKTLDPQADGYMFSRLGMVEGLTDVDDDLNVVPCLASDWSLSEDKLTWTFRLRPNVVFHDGTALTAGIMRDNLRRLQKKGSLLKGLPIAAIEAPDEATLTIATTTPFAPLPAYLARGEAGALSPASFDDKDAVIKPIGAGPFALERFTVKESVETRPHAAYWGPNKPRVDRVVYKAAPEALTRLAMLKAGEIDVAQIMPADAARALAADPGFRMMTRAIGRCRMLGFNMAREPFSDHRARLAVNLAVNRQEIVDAVLDGVGEPSATLFPKGLFWSNAAIPGHPFDPDKARALLAEAGYADRDGDGILDKDGKPLSVTLLTYPERAELPPMAEVVQGQLRKIGLRAEIVSMQVDAANQRRNTGDFDMYLMGRGLLFIPDPDENLMLDYFSENASKDGWGAYRYANPKVDEKLLAARATFDPAQRKALYDEVQALLFADAPMAWLNAYVNVDIVSGRVSGYRMHPIEQSFRLESVELK